MSFLSLTFEPNFSSRTNWRTAENDKQILGKSGLQEKRIKLSVEIHGQIHGRSAKSAAPAPREWRWLT